MSQDLNVNFTLKDCSFGAVQLSTNPDWNKYFYSGYDIEFNFCSPFPVTNFDWSKNVVIFRIDSSLSIHIDNKKKYILVLGKCVTKGLDDITITAEPEYYINFSRSSRKFCLNLHYNGNNSFLLLNATKNISIQAKKTLK